MAIYLGASGDLPDTNDLLSYKNKTASLVLAEDGEIIGKFFAQNRTNVKYGQIPEPVKNALIATEDARFFEHQGIDPRSLMRVLVKSILLSDSDGGGGSTISQQLVKNMYGRKKYGLFTMPVNKVREALIAQRLEKIYNKDQILTLYLNTVPFGENIYGIEAASRRFFTKSASLLRIEEAAVLVGMLKANTKYNPHLNPESAKQRRNVVLKQMAKYRYLSAEEADSLSLLPMKIKYSNMEAAGSADYFLVRIESDANKILKGIARSGGKEWNLDEDGLVIKTTLNYKLQNDALQAYREHLTGMQEQLRNQYKGSASVKESDVVLQAGLLALDPKTGAIKAYVGGINFQTQPYDQIMARRQLASAFKPIVYAAALENGTKPCDYLDNKEIEVEGFEDWSPQNYDNATGGQYSVAGALAKSKNIPTVNLYLGLGFHKLNALWQKMGFSFDLYNAPSVALGTGEASVYELAIAYAAFANGGYKVEPEAIASIATADGKILYTHDFVIAQDRVISLETSEMMCAMLQKAVSTGTGATMHSVYGVSYPWAGKTGTSQNYADAWFGAFNPSLVMVTRVGASTPDIHFNTGTLGSGSTLALPLVARTLRKVESDGSLRSKFL
ncbi:MAG TPA: transglycosylase domain-containing protein, partial [Syntrophomonas sp.]|nr:transglycosylase domain-containing protein [Syntrophomonas sp.]